MRCVAPYNNDMTTADALAALVGGLLIGCAASGLLFVNARLAGISGIVAGVLPPWQGEVRWRLAFLAGLLSGGVILLLSYPAALAGSSPRSSPLLAAAGLLVGLGARLSNGCTSGHGVCGLARRSTRGLLATITFMITGALTVLVVDHVLHLGRP